MSDMNMYNILGKLNSIDPKTPTVKETVKAEPIYESVEPRGSITEAVKSLEEKYQGFKKTVAAIAKGGSADNPEAVAAAIGREKYGKDKFQKAAAAGKKLGEAAKPDFLDVDKDGNKKEPFKKAVKDKKVAEGYDSREAYDKWDPKHPDFKKNYDKYKAKNPDCTVAEFIAHMKGKKVAEGREFKSKDDFDSNAKPGDTYKTAKGTVTKTAKGIKHERGAGKEEKDELDESYTGRETKDGVWRVFKSGKAVAEAGPFKSAKEANAWISKQKKAVKESFEDKLELAREKAAAKGLTKDKTKGSEPNVRLVKGQQYGGSKQKDADEKDDLDEVAPPGAKAERMVKHIKKGYASDGKLTKREKGIAYATAWKAHNKGQVEEGTEFKDTIKNSQAKLTKAPKAKLKESADLRKHPIYTTQEAWDHYAKELAEQQTMEDMSQSNIPSPTNAMPVTKPAVGELDEIARLAGLPTKTPVMNEGPGVTLNGKPVNVNSIEVDGVNDWDRPDFADAYITYAEYADGTPLTDDELDQLTDEHGDLVNQAANDSLVDRGDHLRDLDEEKMGEGNEFSGALAKAKAAGAKEFEVDGKRYTVKEDVTLMADGDDVVNLIRKLAGMDTVEPEMAAPATVSVEPVIDPGVDEVAEERDVEYTNTPREETAGLDAAIPSGTDMHRAKKSYSDKPYRGDNPMAVKEEALWKAYESMISSVKK